MQLQTVSLCLVVNMPLAHLLPSLVRFTFVLASTEVCIRSCCVCVSIVLTAFHVIPGLKLPCDIVVLLCLSKLHVIIAMTFLFK